MVAVLATFAVFLWHPMSGTVDLINTRPPPVPPFCSSKRNAYDPMDCVQCPKDAICFNSKAECPTYFSLEKSVLNDWRCVNHKEELERLADEGLKRVVAHLRKVEVAVPCGQTVSMPASRRDVIDLFEEQIVPLMPTRDRTQLGLREGLLQLYLRELVDEIKMKELYLEQQGSLRVTLASVRSSDRTICVIRRYSVPLVAAVIGTSFFAAYFYLKASGHKCTGQKS
ncbi:Man1-Src1p-carboxy-terminal domain protein [Gregarina niphandrodes]|uniref:Man1-Src1p-carboxy-terminal domain protein n=1 Tax=Gregarina niphandrodes TaxID=110365 RepID=A0A023BC90_GRENI|nr:Man1-Src1p-carboxy-terminal domain protein [Gregarina niphandrodes]EZG82328.1 Man1-Src1p-carboxy-terminal domain protein [Gregarina niphandrodes]|eukprot:XP_011129011.1 Man1-Src1p-carboxy-terminal domain protein [Gregarina niphandrodes]